MPPEVTCARSVLVTKASGDVKEQAARGLELGGALSAARGVSFSGVFPGLQPVES